MRRQTTIVSTTQYEGFDYEEVISTMRKLRKTGSVTVHLSQGTPCVVEWVEKKSVLEGTSGKKVLDRELLTAATSPP